MPIRVRHLDADALRVLAQPLRVRLVGQLRVHGPATATMPLFTGAFLWGTPAHHPLRS